ncbi:MAG: DNA-binding response regulator [Calditrichaeota bacterium]|nr:MAG: DNA-binding response regulator [Calditrichota bacterium]MBL1207295.1 DNA-binding response regulator [Calditrichota bacterium]NOG47127.1 response regulator transcription factor [Calditrichota bacterium]
MHNILIIEDEPGLQITLQDRLVSENYKTAFAVDGNEGYQKALQNNFDLIILDVMLPGKNGFDVCRDLRNKNIETPILMLTARGELPDKIVGLKLGADDYLTKPFEMLELLARVEALLRRGQKPVSVNSDGYTFGSIKVNLKSAEIFKNGHPVELSAQEFRLLKFFIENRNEILSREYLLKNVWEYEEAPTTRTVDVHIAWLRQKLEVKAKHPQFFVTVHSLGYKFLG